MDVNLIIQDLRGTIAIFGDQLLSAHRNTSRVSQNCIYPCQTPKQFPLLT